MHSQPPQEKLNEAIMMLNKNLQEINIQNMDTELVAQMFKNYQSNVLFHLEGNKPCRSRVKERIADGSSN